MTWFIHPILILKNRRRERERDEGFVIVLTDIMNVMPTILSY